MHMHTSAREIYGIFLGWAPRTPLLPEAERTLSDQTNPLRLRLAGSGSALGSDTSPVTSAASRMRSPSTSLTSAPGSTRSPLTKVPLVDPSSRIEARPLSSTTTVACRRDTLSYWLNAAATSDWAGSRPRMTDVPAGTSTFPVGNEIRSTTGEMRRRPPGSGCLQLVHTTSAGSCTIVPQLGHMARPSPGRRYCWETVGDGISSSAYGVCGRLAPHRKQIRSSGCTLTPQSGQVRIAISSLWGGKPLHSYLTARERLGSRYRLLR